MIGAIPTNPFAAVDVAGLRRARSSKWSSFDADVLPAWVADMDFDPPPAVLSGLQRWLNDGFLGYPGWRYHKHLHMVASRHLAHRFGMFDDPERYSLQTDVVQGMHATMQVWSEPGDQILVLTPIYPPFLSVIREQGQGTYLAWVDLSSLGLTFSTDESAADRLRDEARVAFSAGPTFGDGLEHFVRVNLATSPAIVDEILERLCGWIDRQRP